MTALHLFQMGTVDANANGEVIDLMLCGGVGDHRFEPNQVPRRRSGEGNNSRRVSIKTNGDPEIKQKGYVVRSLKQEIVEEQCRWKATQSTQPFCRSKVEACC